MARPPRPKRLISGDGKFEIVPDVRIIKVDYLRARSEQEERAEIARGRTMQILYCRETYDDAMKHGDALEAKGFPSSRIEYCLARRELLEALTQGRFTVVPLQQET